MHTALPGPITTCWCFEIIQGQMVLLTQSAVTLMNKSSEYQNLGEIGEYGFLSNAEQFRASGSGRDS